jgi:hypothetical protein
MTERHLRQVPKNGCHHSTGIVEAATVKSVCGSSQAFPVLGRACRGRDLLKIFGYSRREL